MLFYKTPLKGAYTIDLEKNGDDRGFFARLFCMKEFAEHGLQTAFEQVNNSSSKYKGTLRGLHYQLPPKSEVKVVRCTRGALYDVILDLRRGSPTFGNSFGTELTADNRRMMYVPKGFAHGFITLDDDTEVIYLVSDAYSPHHERGIRWDDPAFTISWPLQPTEISEKDRHHRDFDPNSSLTLD